MKGIYRRDLQLAGVQPLVDGNFVNVHGGGNVRSHGDGCKVV